ncbi:MAG: hypothetical protein ETSY1_03990 [Candidatus Entotheonella factor]|uniref:Uncharacterized protein n=1 Tax=Entotheonella factor TaxID=1429438 RepID=W4LWT2_ENTF1|nr:hypothetical protein [Candidatus Entotheonella palauensis]ETX02343.1 MAG: hypothetical protein ETSY1_03990 [Candidatus Entotheonella factor]
MTVDEQRKLGVKLASKNDAPKTLELIKNTDCVYSQIFECAAEELGVDRLAEIVLKSEEPAWAWALLRHIDGIDDHRDALLEMGAPMAADVQAASEASEATLGRIAAFELDVAGGAGYSAYFTMFWSPSPHVIEPAAGYPRQTPPYKWSNIVRVFASTANLCQYFALPDAPLQTGDTVWMVVDVSGGGWYYTKFRYTFDPTSGATAVISGHGTTTTATFTQKIKI